MHRGLVIVLFLLMGMVFVGQGVGIMVDTRTVARDGHAADAVVLTYRHTPYAGATGWVYIADPLHRDVAAIALRAHASGDWIKVRYVGRERIMAAEVGAPLNTDAILIWTLLGSAVLVFSASATRTLYREQRDWEQLEADLLDPP